MCVNVMEKTYVVVLPLLLTRESPEESYITVHDIHSKQIEQNVVLVVSTVIELHFRVWSHPKLKIVQ